MHNIITSIPHFLSQVFVRDESYQPSEAKQIFQECSEVLDSTGETGDIHHTERILSSASSPGLKSYHVQKIIFIYSYI